MLTPCDDGDPMAAITTAPLLGEKDESMISLVLVKNGVVVVSHLVPRSYTVIMLSDFVNTAGQ